MINFGMARLAPLFVLALAVQACSPTTRSAIDGADATGSRPSSAVSSFAETPPLSLAELTGANAWQVEDWDPAVIYDEKQDGAFHLARIDPATIKPRNVRQVVDYL